MAVYEVVNATQLNADLATVAHAIRMKKGEDVVYSFPGGMAEAIGSIETGITPSGTMLINTNGTHAVRLYEIAEVNVPNIIETSTLPTASADNEGKIYKFTGVSGTYQNGAMYICEEEV